MYPTYFFLNIFSCEVEPNYQTIKLKNKIEKHSIYNLDIEKWVNKKKFKREFKRHWILSEWTILTMNSFTSLYVFEVNSALLPIFSTHRPLYACKEEN